jgi:ATPase family associated with various cellular activities (AAA)
MTDIRELELLVATRTPLILVQTTETRRVEELLRRLNARTGRALYRWALATGLLAVEPSGVTESCQKPTDLLQHILQAPAAGIYLLLDLHRVQDDPVVLSQLQEIAARHEQVPHTLVLVGAELNVPDELRGFTARFELTLPSLQVHEEAAEWGAHNQKRVQAEAPVISALTRNLLGLPANEARRLIRAAIHDDGLLNEADLPAVMNAKYRLLGQEGVLSFETNTTRLTDVAGLNNMKRWLEARRDIFLSDTPPAGLDPPKGLLLLGVQGAGKSLAAKAVAGAWGLPLLRLDFAALYNKYYGETERNLRESLRTAELMSPCVLWIDEIEKGLASDADGGPGKRILGTLLTWMSERRNKAFLVATANDIEALPPELLRKGRRHFRDPSAQAQPGCRQVRLRRASAAGSGLLRRGNRAGGGRRAVFSARPQGRARYRAHPDGNLRHQAIVGGDGGEGGLVACVGKHADGAGGVAFHNLPKDP